MIKKITLLVCYNQYESKRHFVKELNDSLQRQGIQTDLYEWENGPVPQGILDKIKNNLPDITCSFNQPAPDENGKYFWDHLEIPHWMYLVDPVIYELDVLRSPFTILSCVDRNDCRTVQSFGRENVFFCPHAIEKDWIKHEEKPFDVVFLGSCYDPDGLRDYFKKSLSKQLCEVIEEAAEKTLSSPKATFTQALLQSLTSHGLSPGEVNFSTLAYLVDTYARGVERLAMIRSIHNANVHVFGNKAWLPGIETADWSHYLSTQKNVRVYPAVNYADSMQILSRSKICLNSMPFFKDGSHERIFTGIACGSFPVSSRSLFIEEQFTEGKEIAFFELSQLNQMDDLIDSWLGNEKKRLQAISKGQEKILQSHTWDHRATLALKVIPDLLLKGNST